jgi:uncharacterized protein
MPARLGIMAKKAATVHNKNVLPVVIHLLGIVTSFIGALVFYFIGETKDVKEHARVALNFQLVMFVIAIAFGIIASFIYSIISFIPIPLWNLVWLVNIFLCIMAAVKANEGHIYQYPIYYDLIKK